MKTLRSKRRAGMSALMAISALGLGNLPSLSRSSQAKPEPESTLPPFPESEQAVLEVLYLNKTPAGRKRYKAFRKELETRYWSKA